MDVQPVLEKLLWPGEKFFASYQISERERDIVREMLRGRSIREVGAALFISEATVKSHQQNIYNKLKVSSKKQLFDLIRQDILGEYGRETLAFSLLNGFFSDE